MTNALFVLAFGLLAVFNLWQYQAHRRFVRRSSEVLALVVAQRDAALAGKDRRYMAALWEDWQKHYPSDGLLGTDVLSAQQTNIPITPTDIQSRL